MTGISLTIDGLSCGYGAAPVLDRISLPACSGGGMVAVLGPNGSGKSTLLKTIAGLVRYRGSVRVNGTEVAGLGQAEKLQTIGYSPQTAPQGSALLAYEYAWSALKAARPGIGREELERRILNAFGQLGLTGELFRPVSALSGGQRQRLGFSQVLARQPALYLLDEPTSALDLKWEIEALGLMRQRTEVDGALCLVALHDLNLAMRFCDRFVLLAGGGVLAAGAIGAAMTPDLLRRAYGVEARIETCSMGRPMILADSITSRESPTPDTRSWRD